MCVSINGIAQLALLNCRRMYSNILSQPNRVPQDFGDDALTKRAAQFRATTKCCSLPYHIRAFIIRNDTTASDEERTAASHAIKTLLDYCRKHWKLYVDTIVKKTRSHGFPLQCLSCDTNTRWHAASGLRVDSLTGQDHQYCKKFTANLTESMKTMLKLPTIRDMWSHVRKDYDPDDNTQFQHREEAKQLAKDLGYVSAVIPVDAPQIPQHVDDIPVGHHCFACVKSDISQPLVRITCEWCGTPFTINN